MYQDFLFMKMWQKVVMEVTVESFVTITVRGTKASDVF